MDGQFEFCVELYEEFLFSGNRHCSPAYVYNDESMEKLLQPSASVEKMITAMMDNAKRTAIAILTLPSSVMCRDLRIMLAKEITTMVASRIWKPPKPIVLVGNRRDGITTRLCKMASDHLAVDPNGYVIFITISLRQAESVETQINTEDRSRLNVAPFYALSSTFDPLKHVMVIVDNADHQSDRILRMLRRFNPQTTTLVLGSNSSTFAISY